MTRYFLILALVYGIGSHALAQAPKPAPTPTPAAPVPSSSTEAFKQAQNLYQDGDWAAALTAFQGFEKNFKYSTALPEVIYYQGWCLANQGRHPEAINVFQRLITSYSNNTLIAEAILKQAECYREQKDAAKAIELYRRFQQDFPKHDLAPQAMLGEAWANFKSGNSPAAKGVINAVRSRFPDNDSAKLDALFLLGQIYTEERDFENANKVYREITAQRSNPRATEALYLAAEALFSRGETLLRDNKTAEGHKAYRDAINYYKAVRSKAALVDIVQRQIKQWTDARGQIVVDRGVTLWERQLESLKRLAAQIRERPDLRVLALFRVANCFQAMEMPEEASVVYAFLREKYPDDRAAEQIFFGLIQTLTARGQMEKANAETEKFKEKYPKSLLLNNASLIQAEAQFGQKNYSEALVNYAKALTAAKEPATIETIEFRVATCYFNLEQFEKSRDAFVEFAQKHATSKIRPDALFFVGLCRYELANRSNDPTVAKPHVEAAVQAYEEIRAKHADYDKIALVTFRLGYLYSFAGAFDRDAAGKLTSTNNFDKAIASFQEFIQKWPDYKDSENRVLMPEAMYQIARNHLSAQRPEQAIAAFKALLDKFPDHDLSPYAALEIGTTYAGMKDPSKMIDALRLYVQKYPTHAKVEDAMYAIATELENQKRLDEAILAYRDIISRALSSGTLSEQARNSAIGAQLRVAAILELRNDPKAVVADCEQVLAKFAGDAVAARAMISKIADLYRKGHLHEEAYKKLDELAQQYQVNAPIRHACVISIMELAGGEKDFARANLAVARLLGDPDKGKIPLSGFISIGNVSLKTSKFDQARENYERVLAGAADDPKLTTLANVGLGQALLGLKQYDKAQQTLETALADTQNCPRGETELALAKVLEGQNKIKEAVDLYNKLLGYTKGETQFDAAFHLGNIFFNMVSDPAKMKENRKLALAYYARLLFATGPMAEEAAFRSAECHESLGNNAVALSSFQGYAKRFPTGRFADEARERIKKLSVVKAP